MAAGRMLNRSWTLLGALLACLAGCAAMSGCAEPAPAGFERVALSGRTFTLELAADHVSRTMGLGGRTSIPEDGGMLFVFERPDLRAFVMRDCVVPIDIIFLDGAGNIVAMHQMVVEEPRRPDETPQAYELRMKRYPSRFNAQFVIELRGGMLDQLDLAVGDTVDLDIKKLIDLLR